MVGQDRPTENRVPRQVGVGCLPEGGLALGGYHPDRVKPVAGTGAMIDRQGSQMGLELGAGSPI